jgi:hypothetical protein
MLEVGLGRKPYSKNWLIRIITVDTYSVYALEIPSEILEILSVVILLGPSSDYVAKSYILYSPFLKNSKIKSFSI